MHEKFRKKAGFSLIELVIYLGLTIILLGLLAGILLTILRVQENQTAGFQISTELNFLMNTIKTDVRQGTGISVTTSTLTISTATSSTNPIIINSSGGVAYRKVGTASAEALTDSDLSLDTLSFQEFTGTSTTAVQITATLTSNPNNIQTKETRTLQATVSTLQ